MTVPALEWSPLWPHVEPLIVDAQRGKRLPPANSSGWIGPIRSPLREERNPSFSVKPDSETDPGGFTDHGTGDKGSLWASIPGCLSHQSLHPRRSRRR
jgi:hypothetical protein